MRYDKYNPVGGGFRALLAANWTGSDDPFGVGLDVDGHVVVGAGTTGVVGVMIKTRDALAGQVVDIMKLGEIVEFDGDPATIYYADPTTGVISDTESIFPVGFTVELSRLVVAIAGGGGAGAGGTVEGGQTSIVALTDNTSGTANNTLEALVSGSVYATDVAAIRNNFADLAAKVNTIISTLDAAHLTL
jgi:hypothetical protein